VSRALRVVLLGCGTVGRGFLELLERERPRLIRRHGIDPQVVRILVRRPGLRDGIDPAVVTTSPLDAIDTPADIVLELMGGLHTAGALIRRALVRGQSVVTANKALLATAADELAALASKKGAFLGFEAAVCGGVPIIRTLRDSLAGVSITSLEGVVNGTCNYILTRMERGSSYVEAVQAARECGFAEADPSMDVSGEDAAQKMTILSRLAFDEPIRRVERSGIERVTRADVAATRAGGSVLRQVAVAQRVAGGISVSVGLRSISGTHPLARLDGEENGVIIRGEAIGELVLTGRGAGSLPTASAVLADVIACAGEREGRKAAA
jgi:homoserine dehydrogenase